MAWSGVHRSFIAQALVSCALLIAFSGRLLARRRARDERSLTHGFALLVVTLAGYVSLDVVDGRRLAELLERPWILGLYLLVAAVISYAHHLRGRAMRAGRDVVTKESLRFNRRRLAALTLLLALAPAAWTTIELARRWGDTRVVWDVETGERVASVAPERTFTSTLGWTADARVAFQDAEATYLAAIDGGALTRIAGRHALTPDGRWLVGYAPAGVLTARRVAAPQAASDAPRAGEKTSKRMEVVSLDPVGDGATALVTAVDRRSRDQRPRPVGLDLETGRVLHEFPQMCEDLRGDADDGAPAPGCLRGLRVTQDGRFVLALRDDWTLEIRAGVTLTSVTSFALPEGPRALARPLDAVAVEPAARWLYLASPWGIDRAPVRRPEGTARARTWPHELRDAALELTRGGTRLLVAATPKRSAEREPEVLLLDAAGGLELLAEHPASGFRLQGDGRYVLNGVQLVDAEAGAVVTGRLRSSSWRAAPQVDDEGRRVAFNTADGVEVWDVARDEPLLARADNGELSRDGARLLTHSPRAAPWAGLLAGLPGLLLALLLALESRVDALKTRPNEGVLRTMRRSAAVFAVVFIACFAAYLALRGALLVSCRWDELLLGALPSLTLLSLAAALALGGFTVIGHYVLRMMLALAGHAPWRYARFLDHAVERALLRRVGGGYLFIHRLHAEYFAAHAEERLTGALTAGDPKRAPAP